MWSYVHDYAYAAIRKGLIEGYWVHAVRGGVGQEIDCGRYNFLTDASYTMFPDKNKH